MTSTTGRVTSTKKRKEKRAVKVNNDTGDTSMRGLLCTEKGRCGRIPLTFHYAWRGSDSIPKTF